jgi:hypothetical protein
MRQAPAPADLPGLTIKEVEIYVAELAMSAASPSSPRAGATIGS